jgi:fructokinase
MSKNETEHEKPLQSTDFPIIVYGEVLHDCFSGERRVLGGAPFNVAWGLGGFGHQPIFVSAVGDDDDGHLIRSRMADWGLAVEGVQRLADKASGEVYVTVEDDEPSYEICEDRAWDHISDQGLIADDFLYHGSLALRSEKARETFEALAERSPAKRFFDVNLRAPYDSLELVRQWMRGADWVKLNIDELALLSDNPKLSFEVADSAIRELIDGYGIGNVLLTGGKQGARIDGEIGRAICSPAPQPDPFVDTVGAGDAFTAFTIHGLLSGMDVEEIVRRASGFAAKVCGLNGATTNDTAFYK